MQQLNIIQQLNAGNVQNNDLPAILPGVDPVANDGNNENENNGNVQENENGLR